MRGTRFPCRKTGACHDASVCLVRRSGRADAHSGYTLLLCKANFPPVCAEYMACGRKRGRRCEYLCPESNRDLPFRRGSFYPLNYKGAFAEAANCAAGFRFAKVRLFMRKTAFLLKKNAEAVFFCKRKAKMLLFFERSSLISPSLIH